MISVSVCLSVRQHISELHVRSSIFGACYMALPRSVLLWRRCHMLSTFGFVNDVILTHNRLYGGLSIDTAATSDVTMSSCAGLRRCCVVLVDRILYDGGRHRARVPADGRGRSLQCTITLLLSSLSSLLLLPNNVHVVCCK